MKSKSTGSNRNSITRDNRIIHLSGSRNLKFPIPNEWPYNFYRDLFMEEKGVSFTRPLDWKATADIVLDHLLTFKDSKWLDMYYRQGMTTYQIADLMSTVMSTLTASEVDIHITSIMNAIRKSDLTIVLKYGLLSRLFITGYCRPCRGNSYTLENTLYDMNPDMIYLWDIQMDIPSQAIIALKKNLNIWTVGQLIATPTSKIVNCKGVGPKSIERIKEVLIKMGYSFDYDDAGIFNGGK